MVIHLVENVNLLAKVLLSIQLTQQHGDVN